MTDPFDHTEDGGGDAALAAEYALNLLTPQEAAAFEARLNVEPDLRALVADWHEEFATLSDDIDDVTPPAAAKNRLRAALFGTQSRWKRRIRETLWLLGGVVAASLLVFYVNTQSLPQAVPTHVSEMVSDDENLAVVAYYLPDSQSLRISRTNGAPAEGRDWELWLIAGDDAPISLGVLPSSAEGDIELPAELAQLVAGGTLAISDEPLGGSPTGQATGPVLAVGPVQAL